MLIKETPNKIDLITLLPNTKWSLEFSPLLDKSSTINSDLKTTSYKPVPQWNLKLLPNLLLSIPPRKESPMDIMLSSNSLLKSYPKLKKSIPIKSLLIIF